MEPSSSSSVDASSEWDRILIRVRTAAMRAGLFGTTLRGGLHVLSTLLYLLGKLRKSRGKPQRRGLSWFGAIEDTARYTAFLASMGGIYVAVDEGIAALLGKHRTSRWRSLVAGAVAGQMLVITGSKPRHYSLATYVMLRGLTLIIRTGNKPTANPVLRSLLSPTRMQHGDTALMCLSAAQIIYSFVMMPSTLPPSYVRFLTKAAAKEPWVWKAVQEQALRNWNGTGPGPLKLLRGTPYANLESKTPCGFWHPGQSCHAHAVASIPSSYARSLSVYIPMYLVPAVMVHRQALIKKPMEIWPKVALGIARSSLFLTLFIAAGFGGVCLGINATGISTGPIIAASVWVGGLATLLEKKSRRMELAQYCLSRAVESFSRCLLEWGVVDAEWLPARLDVLLFSAGCAAIMHCYSDDQGQNRDVFRTKYLNVLDFIFGSVGMQTGSIVHLPSNKDLIKSASRRIRSLSNASLSEMDSSLDSHRHSLDSRQPDARQHPQKGRASDSGGGRQMEMNALPVAHKLQMSRMSEGLDRSGTPAPKPQASCPPAASSYNPASNGLTPTGTVLSSSTFLRGGRRSHGSSIALLLNATSHADNEGKADADDEENVRPSWGFSQNDLGSSVFTTGGTRVRLKQAIKTDDAQQRNHASGLDDDGLAARFIQGASSRIAPKMRRTATEPCLNGLSDMRVHGLDRGIRGSVMEKPVSDVSFSSHTSLGMVKTLRWEGSRVSTTGGVEVEASSECRDFSFQGWQQK